MLCLKAQNICHTGGVTCDLELKLQYHSLVVKGSSDITLTAPAAIQVVAQSPVFWLETNGQTECRVRNRTAPHRHTVLLQSIAGTCHECECALKIYLTALLKQHPECRVISLLPLSFQLRLCLCAVLK